MPARCGACTSWPEPCGPMPTPRAPTPRCSRGGTGRRSPAASSCRPRRSRRPSSPAHTRMRTSTSPSPSSMRRSTKRALANLLLLAAAGCPRPTGVPTPAGEPELRVALAVGAASAALGGDGELFVTDDGNGAPVGSIPAGLSWTVIPDSSGTRLQLLKPDGTRTEPHRGIAAVNVTENRFAAANGRRYRGRIHVIAAPPGAGLTLVNRVGIEAYADIRDQVYNGVVAETPQVWDAVRRTAGQVLRYRGEIIEAYFHSTCGF